MTDGRGIEGKKTRPALPRAAAALLLVAAAAGFYFLGLDEYLRIDLLKARQAELKAMLETDPALLISAFMLFTTVAAALSVPGAVLGSSLAAGAIFGLGLGAGVVLLSLTVAAALAFLFSRYLVGAWIQRRFGGRMKGVAEGLGTSGAFYLLSLRLLAVIPYFLINLAMGATRIRLGTFALCTFVGMLPSTLIYVNAGTQLAAIESPGDILSTRVVLSLALLGCLPLAARYLIPRLARRHAGGSR